MFWNHVKGEIILLIEQNNIENFLNSDIYLHAITKQNV